LAVGYYEDWRPTRDEVALLVDFELGRAAGEELEGPLPTLFGTGQDVNRSADGAAHRGANRLANPSDSIRAVRSAAPDRSAATQTTPRRTALATFNVDCGVLAPPFHFIASGLTSEGWTIRLGQRYRRTFLHYRLVTPLKSIAPQPQSAAPLLFNSNIVCVGDVQAPGEPADGRSRKHSVGPGVVIGSRGPWPVADSATTLSFLITAQSPPGVRQRRHPSGSLGVNLRSGVATWRTAPGISDTSTGRTAIR
jgi:hypothetical protein